MTTNNKTMQAQDALLKLQDEINTEQQYLETFKSAISQQESTLAGLQKELPDLAALYRQREGMLADIAAGEADRAALTTLNNAISAAEANKAKIEPEIATCHETIAGLKRKVDAKVEGLDVLRNRSRQFIRRFLLELADSVGADFLAATAVLISHYKRIEGIGALLRELGHLPDLRAHGGKMNLPAYNSPVFDGKAEFNNRGALYSGIDWRDVREAAKQEAANIRALGVDFSYGEE